MLLYTIFLEAVHSSTNNLAKTIKEIEYLLQLTSNCLTKAEERANKITIGLNVN